MKIKLFLILLGLCFEIHAQQIDFKNLENISNCQQHKGPCLEYDTDGILEQKVFYSQQSTVDSIHYFNLKGERIFHFSPFYQIDSTCFAAINIEVLENINSVDEVFHAQGLIIASFFVNSNLELMDIRISRGIDQFIDEEIKKAIRSIDTSMLRCAVNETELQQVLVFIRL
jgi:hypothetical protein